MKYQIQTCYQEDKYLNSSYSQACKSSMDTDLPISTYSRSYSYQNDYPYYISPQSGDHQREREEGMSSCSMNKTSSNDSYIREEINQQQERISRARNNNSNLKEHHQELVLPSQKYKGMRIILYKKSSFMDNQVQKNVSSQQDIINQARNFVDNYGTNSSTQTKKGIEGQNFWQNQNKIEEKPEVFQSNRDSSTFNNKQLVQIENEKTQCIKEVASTCEYNNDEQPTNKLQTQQSVYSPSPYKKSSTIIKKGIQKSTQDGQTSNDSKYKSQNQRCNSQYLNISNNNYHNTMQISSSESLENEEEQELGNNQELFQIYFGYKEYEFTNSNRQIEYTTIYFYIVTDSFSKVVHKNAMSNQSCLKKEFFTFLFIDLIEYLKKHQNHKRTTYCLNVDQIYSKKAKDIIEDGLYLLQNQQVHQDFMKYNLITLYHDANINMYINVMNSGDIYQQYLNAKVINNYNNHTYQQSNPQYNFMHDEAYFDFNDLGLADLLKNSTTKYIISDFLKLFKQRDQISSNNYFLHNTSKPLKSFKDFEQKNWNKRKNVQRRDKKNKVN